MSLSSLLSEVQPTLCSVCTQHFKGVFALFLLAPIVFSNGQIAPTNQLIAHLHLQKVICSRVAMARCLFKSQVTWHLADSSLVEKGRNKGSV